MSTAQPLAGAVPSIGFGTRAMVDDLLETGSGREARTVAGSDFDILYRASYHRLVRQLSVVLGDVQEAEDVVQEAFSRAAVRWDRVSRYEAPEAWVRRVALNLASNSLRRGRRRAAMLLRLRPGPPAADLSVDGIAVAQAMRALPLRHRQVLALHYLEDMSVEEIATTLHVRVGTVKSRLSRARAALAEQLGDGNSQELHHA